MAKTLQKSGLMLIALLLILACATPLTAVTPPPPGFVETAIAGTYSVAASQTAQVKALVQADSKPVTVTTSPTSTVTPFPTFTRVVLGASQVIALVDTSCRFGPGSAYGEMFLFRKGRTAELAGRSADGSYWIIRNPNRPDRVCWVHSSTVRVSTLTGGVPVMTAPPRPTPTRTSTNAPRPGPPTSTFTATLMPGVTSTHTPTETMPVVQFDLSYNGQDDCPSTPAWWLNFELSNNGAVDFESISLMLTDNTTATNYSYDLDDFPDRDACNPVTTSPNLPVAFSLIVSSPELNYNPAGHSFTVAIMLCDEDGQVGRCDTKTINFTP